MVRFIWAAVIAVFLLFPHPAFCARTEPFMMGADISWTLEDEAQGAAYYDNGVKKDLFDILTAHGFNYIRLRVFVDPHAAGGYSARRNEAFCDLAHTLTMAKRAKAAHMGFYLDIHYSDTWTSPGHQAKPSAWKDLSFPDLTRAVHDFTFQTVKACKDAGVEPSIVSVGNEITDGMLFPDGHAPSHWDNFATLLKAGISAVREVDPKIRVMLHHHLGRSDLVVRDWIDNLQSRGVSFDIMGLSCYAQSKPGDWKTTFDDLAARYPKLKLAAAEYSPKKREINDVVFNAPNDAGIGTFIWEPTRHMEAMFDRNGKNAGDLNTTVDAQGLPVPMSRQAATTQGAPATQRRGRGNFTHGGRYDTNPLIKLYDQMAKDYGLPASPPGP